ncbi:MAG: phosphoketolase family protein, partial [Candidatus Peregrinibacteria bacterium]
ELKIRYVNISELTALGLGDFTTFKREQKEVDQYFTPDKPVVINYHGYTNDMEQILWPYANPRRFSLHGYKEEGSTTSPFDLTISNGVSRYHLAIDLIEQGSKHNKRVAGKKPQLLRILKKKISDHQAYIKKYGDDPEDVKKLKFSI